MSQRISDELFELCEQVKQESQGKKPIWDELLRTARDKFKEFFKDKEELRDKVRQRERALGIKNDFSSPEITKSTYNTKAKILLWDAETSPLLCMTWGLYNQNINTDAIVQDWHFLSWSAKWLFSDEIHSDVLTSEEAKNHDDKRIIETLYSIINDADIVISHNGDRFDNVRLNTRIIYHNMKPLMPYQSIDTLKIAKNHFDFSSRKLDYINKYLGLPQKTDHNFDIWKKSYFGDAESLKKLKFYNIQDVRCLEDLFLKLRPFTRGLPNMNVYSEENVSICPSCGSNNLEMIGKFYYTSTGKYKQFECLDCGSYGRSRFTELSRYKNKSIIR